MEFTSERVYLRELKESDWIDVHQYASQEIASKYQPWGPNSEDETKAFVKQAMLDANNNPRTRFAFAIVNKKTEQMIGAGEFNIRDFHNQNGEIAYIVNPDYWGMGIATEVAYMLVSFGFTELNMHRIFATCDPRNIGSAKVMEKVGMRKEGRIRDDLLINGGWRDSLLYSLLKHEWKPLGNEPS